MGNSDTEPATGRHDPDCVFCRIIAGEIPSERVHEDDQLIAFKDLHPQAPVHVLVVPREHRRDVTELAQQPDLLARIATVAGEVAATHADGEFRLIFNTGASAGQSVFHVHAHVLAGGKLAEGAL
ncbi:MAG: histidine triad nucleotide-binding protein [Brachybacterium sp.]|uniref:histidine triad nucleotide-binding protein n=1 Tax=Brachybacterium sp. TaxID=1891286 RepID=UPI00264E8C7B|nr:histidine triad nucleotide-binding protein [Brachybacterium sp.]MDN6301845.1 histidine triad nucleotide-binding protein [Brachybacterium sp.]MDN6328403.1 histidine triad nucleotide-binding protein [Brachybacterium sp.]MDN6398907.1 histidine triad nucleotide-binding protein [Brachybacterium sp.]